MYTGLKTKNLSGIYIQSQIESQTKFCDLTFAFWPLPSVFCNLFSITTCAVAQLDRAPDFESVGRPFESGRAYQQKPME